jgi:hypothetical protein
MFIYLLIAAELAILCTVFWYIYVQEPKSIKYSAFNWGRYDSPELIAITAEDPQVSPWMLPGNYIQHPQTSPGYKQLGHQSGAWKVRPQNMRGRHRRQVRLVAIPESKLSWLKQFRQWLAAALILRNR